MYYDVLKIILWFLAEKYCQIVISEGGLGIMTELLEDPSVLDAPGGEPGVIHCLAETVISQCLMYMKNAVGGPPQ